VRRPRYSAIMSNESCVLDASSRVHCPGSGTEVLFGGLPVAGEHASAGNGCAITASGQYVCMINGTPTVQPNPLGLVWFERPCALDGDGDAYCSGTNNAGELGNGTVDPQRYPMPNSYPYTAVVGGHRFESIATGRNHRCALTAAGVAYCWGYDQMGQLGSSATAHICQTSLNSGGDCHPSPLQVEGGLTFVQITAGESHTCGLTAGGTAYCWGYAVYGQLGTGSFTGPDLCTTNPGGPGANICAAAPVQVQSGGVQFKQIEAFGHTTCAIATDGRLFCWGGNDVGQLGTGNTTNRNVPTLVSGGLLFRDVGGSYNPSGQTSTAALTTDGRLFRWGLGVLTPTQITGQI
jgi:alpha-tubulin suppressor-like RCC1 family protein